VQVWCSGIILGIQTRRFPKEPFYWLNQRETVGYMAALVKHYGNSGFVQELNKIKELDISAITGFSGNYRAGGTL